MSLIVPGHYTNVRTDTYLCTDIIDPDDPHYGYVIFVFQSSSTTENGGPPFTVVEHDITYYLRSVGVNPGENPNPVVSYENWVCYRGVQGNIGKMIWTVDYDYTAYYELNDEPGPVYITSYFIPSPLVPDRPTVSVFPYPIIRDPVNPGYVYPDPANPGEWLPYDADLIEELDYDADLGWDEANSVWTPTARGGGRYREQFVAVGKDGEIYYGDV